MIKFYGNTKVIKNVYTFNDTPVDNYDHVNNLGYMLGTCTWNINTFDECINKLVNDGVIVKLYDTKGSEFREASYEFVNGNGEIEFFGENYMSYTLTYNF